MGDEHLYQPLTKKDKITVVLYRIGIVVSALVIALIAYLSAASSYSPADAATGLKFTLLIIVLYIAVGMSVFFIHLYVSSFHRALKKLYFGALAALAVLLITGAGDIFRVVVHTHASLLLLLPLSGCLGFITAKEAFCFKLIEGYLLAFIMPLYLVLLAAGAMTAQGASYGLILIAAMLLLFTIRKAFMPLHFDIGDKSAYS